MFSALKGKFYKEKDHELPKQVLGLKGIVSQRKRP
jgi:hypothetical protein